MRITRIKISGFKSFVDPTTLTLPGNLTGVVGPNGCGKSNIIDALIWVLGESSAKHLRGDSMSDVIFNGSNARKPVGQATVELVFDNSDGTIGGQYAGFGEISIKRTVTRDGVSAYYLNGARCRRKDITNVFLGTGIGSRGYSVIEQGMISRVIEAHPEELRSFLEEAAGISKYKERRRETENRMRHAQDNMARLTDIRDELDKQLGHLQRQARAAERYQELKAEERRTSARGLAVRWREQDGERARAAAAAGQFATALEAEIAKLRALEARQVAARERQLEATDSFNRLQSEFYARSADISRLEQAIKHAEERAETLQQDGQDARAAHAELERSLRADEEQRASVAQRMAELDPQLASARAGERAAHDAMRAGETALDQWQHAWDAFNRDHSALAQHEQSATIRLEHLLASVSEAEQRSVNLSEEAARNQTATLLAERERQRGLAEQSASERARLNAARNAVRANLTQARGALHLLEGSLHEHQVQLEQQRGRLASLHVLQEAAYGDAQSAVAALAAALGLDIPVRLAELLDIEPGYERALEAALRVPLGSLCGPDLPQRALAVASARSSGLTLIDLARGVQLERPPHTLLAKLKSPVDMGPLLDGVYVAADIDAARDLLRDLGARDVVVLKDGTVFGANWVQLAASAAAEDSILLRERMIAELDARIELHDAETANLRRQVEGGRARIADMEQDEHRFGEGLDQALQVGAAQGDELARIEAEVARREARAADVSAELARLTAQSSAQLGSLADLERERDGAQRALAVHAGQRSGLSDQRATLQAALDRARQTWRERRDAAHQYELSLEQARVRHLALDETLARNVQAREVLARRCAELETALVTSHAPRAELGQALEQALRSRVAAEQRLGGARQTLSELDLGMQQAAAERAALEQANAECQRQLEDARLEQRASEVRLQELVLRFAQSDEDLAATLASLNETDTEAALQEELERIAARIARLGPINLAAIEEYNQLAERKAYLDRQFADLSEALETLQEAIRKIDRETRSRFRDTFDKVNNGLQTMFPVLFGGGHAYLEMTGEDLLETGVTVMARPPGKRNSTIHLLSGGEKALTALAFVFSIFELNPAPFCLLDEVDAPLDDNNVVRLTEMLRAMARSVQFLFVTHNKITMEIAEQLIGVTMQEAGVSRLVAVNMEQAVELAATA